MSLVIKSGSEELDLRSCLRDLATLSALSSSSISHNWLIFSSLWLKKNNCRAIRWDSSGSSALNESLWGYSGSQGLCPSYPAGDPFWCSSVSEYLSFNGLCCKSVPQDSLHNWMCRLIPSPGINERKKEHLWLKILKQHIFNKYFCDFFFFSSCDRISFSVLLKQQSSKNLKPFRESVFVFSLWFLFYRLPGLKDHICQDGDHCNMAWLIHYPSMLFKVTSKSVQQGKSQKKMLHVF